MPEPEESDAAQLAAYRALIEQAAAALAPETSRRVAGATAAVFAALDRRDHERRELLAIAHDLAGLPLAPIAASPELVALVERARRLVG